MNTRRNASLAVTAAAVLVLTTACGQEKGEETTADSRAAGVAATAQSGGADAQGAAATPAGRLTVRDAGGLGEVVTDGAGFTLYRFDNDTAAPSKSNCIGDCAKAWPIVAARGATVAPGIDAALLGEVTRADGTKQLTIAGWPMYRFAKDTRPGDTKGQGVGGTWFAAAPDGKKAQGGAPGGADPGTDVYGSGAGAVAAAPAGLSTRRDAELGEIVVDKNGMTVYRFLKDSAWPMKTACVGECLTKWPVVAPVAKNDTKGILKKGFVTFSRPDGIKQQTIDCWPLYTFGGDTKAGDTNGQGVGGTWFAVTPNGKAVGAPAAAQ
ncbi:SCO0930 family lipoprotein [Streptomyces sp. NPDC020965]|uniref:SCO0930 family lipoprotein n=1 Tax=Streptomyces sp. NPDC020965 TaxID=3365105 RepID=UPI00379100A2